MFWSRGQRNFWKSGPRSIWRNYLATNQKQVFVNSVILFRSLPVNQGHSHRGGHGPRVTHTPCALPHPPCLNAWRLRPPQARFGALCHDSSRRPCLCPDCAGRLDPAAAAAAFHWQSSEATCHVWCGNAAVTHSAISVLPVPAASPSLYIRPAGIELQVPIDVTKRFYFGHVFTF